MKRMLLFVLLAPLAGLARAAEPPRAQADFFEKKVRPILAKNCHTCHSQAAGKKKGGLMLDSLAGMLKGGDSGAALVPGKPEQSLLLRAVRQTDKDLKMPPKGKLTAEQVGALEQWIKLGAPWPGAGMTVRSPGKITDEDRRWWAFQPLSKPTPPDVADDRWAKNPIDRFIYARLKAEGLQPAPSAEPETLVRRVYFDLVGLPPTAAEIEAFKKSASRDPQAAIEDVVDRLLQSPRYGERWARHWLDLVRYAESDGFRIDDYRSEAWRYRDYVIRAFNADKPYDRFVQEQLAGDELWPDDPDARTATGFLRHWIYEYNQRDVRTQWDNILNDLTDTTGDVFLGLGLGCARCHDHKFDPILQKDYFRLQAFFAPILPRDDVPLVSAPELAAYREKLAKWEAATADIRREMEQIEAPVRHKAAEGAIDKFPAEIQAMVRKPAAERTPLEHQLAELAYRQVYYEFARLEGRIKDADKQQLIALKKKLAAVEAERPAPLPCGLTVTDVGSSAPPTFIPKKAKIGALEPGFLTLLDDQPAHAAVPTAPSSTGRRTALARWITRPDNPLATRVIVNRVWQYHFGRGLVATASDFGRLGERPSHPELLDWLATHFASDGFTFKKLHRLIVTSEAYRQSATVAQPQAAVVKDPTNRLLWRMTTRRLDAEQIRDAILSATGELDVTAGGPGVDPGKPRRSIYCRWLRNSRDPLLDVFDLPEGFVSTAERNVTTTATQALLMINSPYMLARAHALAERLQKEKYADDPRLVEAAFRLTFGRPPTTSERDRLVAFLKRQTERGIKTVVAGTGFQSEKMPYREGRAAVLQPDGPQVRFQVPDHASLPTEDFTVEAFVLLRSTYEDASVRTIASHWGGDKKKPGWSFGVTSKKSQFKPQTLVLQLMGDPEKNGTDYEAIFSGLHIGLNKPYFVAVSVHLGDADKQGVTFYAKDLSNDDEQLQSVRCGHKMTSLPRPGVAFTIGGHAGQPLHTWDGLIDDVRLSKGILHSEQLLLTAEGVTDRTMGYWQFEAKPGVYKDSSSHGNDIRVAALRGGEDDPRKAALIDLCHVLLNANEFLYVD
jgi:Protein of unknown function (DUF1553)/Protein of unknown function (DUF1549)/Planctomycete cytochrome C